MGIHAWSAEIFTKRLEKNSTTPMVRTNFVMDVRAIGAIFLLQIISLAILKNLGLKTEGFYLCLLALYYFYCYLFSRFMFINRINIIIHEQPVPFLTCFLL